MTVLIIFAVVVGLAVALFVAVHVYAYSTIWITTQKFRAKLRKRNRILSRDEAKQRIARNEGILLVDLPTRGWNVARVWWSPRADFVPRTERTEKRELASKEDMENHGRFIDALTGVASLVDGFVITRRLKKYLKRHFGLDECAFVLTGDVLLDQHLRNRNKNANPPPVPRRF